MPPRVRVLQRTPGGGRLEPDGAGAASGARALVSLVRGVGALVLGASSACSSGSPVAPAPGAEPLGPPTYHRDVAPILARSCTKCHHEGGIGRFALTSHSMARAMAPALTAAVTARRMPPWGAHDTSECTPPLPWRDDERLSLEEIRVFQRWEAAGAPEGDPSDAPPEAEPAQSLRLVAPMLDLAPRSAFQPAATSTDEFRCFVLDAPELEAGGFISAIDVVPGNRKIVHHVSVFADVGGVAASRAGPDGSFACPSGSVAHALDGEMPKLTWMLAWAPGARPLELPSNVGIRVQPRSKIVMEVHYSAGGEAVEPDRTHLQLVMAQDKPEYTVSSWGIGNYPAMDQYGDGLLAGDDGIVEFRVPAGATNHVEEMQAACYVPGPLPIFGLRAHAHLGAVDLKVDLVREGEKQCLLQDRWDFHWQRVYTFDAPIDALPAVRWGDRIRLRCTYDNSMGNRRLGQALWERGLQPMDLQLGEDTLSEMCLVELLYIEKTP